MAEKQQKPQQPRRSRRVSWPEAGHDEDVGEVRITTKRLFAFVTFVILCIGAVPTYWTISDHWMNRQEIQKMMRDHADHDASAQAWTTFGFAQNRVEYLDDKLAECELRRAAHKPDPVELGICTRYESKYKAKADEANQLRSKAVESTREKAVQ